MSDQFPLYDNESAIRENEVYILGIVDAIRRLFPDSDRKKKRELFLICVPWMKDKERIYWMSWHSWDDEHDYPS